LALGAGFYVFQGRLLYYPESKVEGHPAQYGLDYEDVYFQAADGTRLHGWFVPTGSDAPVILFCHGNAGNIGDRINTIRLYHSLGYQGFYFDYRGYGKSEGYPDEQGTYQDVEGAWAYLEEKGISATRIIAVGRSLGGGLASWIAREKQPAGLVLESTFTSVIDLGSEIYPFLPVRFLGRYRYPVIDYIKDRNCPLLIMHSRRDETVPFKHSQSLLKAGGEGTRFQELKGGHTDNFLVSREDYLRTMSQFVDDVTAQ
jgi:uncharacterized protein